MKYDKEVVEATLREFVRDPQQIELIMWTMEINQNSADTIKFIQQEVTEK